MGKKGQTAKAKVASTRSQGTAPAEEILELDQALDLLKISRSTLYRWIREGRLAAMKAGRQWRFHRKDIEKFLKGEGAALPATPVSPEPLLADLRRLLREAKAPEPEAITPGMDPLEQAVHVALHLMAARRASDLHIAPHTGPDEPAPIRLRIDGGLHEIARFDPRLLPHFIQRWRRFARCEPAGIQQGRASVTMSGIAFDLRFSFLPLVLGDSVTVRALPPGSLPRLGPEYFGYSAKDFEKLGKALHSPNGLVVFAGPTGSGKTTTAYAAVLEIAVPGHKTMSLESPVEILLPGVNQIQIDPAAGLTLPAAFRAVMRSDPDVVVVGELSWKDPEALNYCIELCVTGHLVLTTLHARNAADTVRGLLDIGADPYLLSDSLRLILAQRLVRLLCRKCAVPYSPSREELAPARRALMDGGVDEDSLPRDFKKPVGCPACGATGHRGRNVVAETLVPTPALIQAIRSKAGADEIRRLAIAGGMTPIPADAAAKAYAGTISLAEAMRVGGEPNSG